MTRPRASGAQVRRAFCAYVPVVRVQTLGFKTSISGVRRCTLTRLPRFSSQTEQTLNFFCRHRFENPTPSWYFANRDFFPSCVCMCVCGGVLVSAKILYRVALVINGYDLHFCLEKKTKFRRRHTSAYSVAFASPSPLSLPPPPQFDFHIHYVTPSWSVADVRNTTPHTRASCSMCARVHTSLCKHLPNSTAAYAHNAHISSKSPDSPCLRASGRSASVLVVSMCNAASCRWRYLIVTKKHL